MAWPIFTIGPPVGLAEHTTVTAGGVGEGGKFGDWSGDGLGKGFGETSAGEGDGDGEGETVGAAVLDELQATSRTAAAASTARFMPA
jgi:hypothetical protein